MKWAAFWKNAEVEVYCFYHLKHRKLVLDSLLVVCFVVPLVLGRRPIAYVALAMGCTLAVLQLSATMTSNGKKKRRQQLIGQRSDEGSKRNY